mgnify:CR=1 FL=1
MRHPWLASLGLAALAATTLSAQSDDASPPEKTVRLVFVHHSTGENWLADDNGGLARALQGNRYFVSDTYYGWGPGDIGDRTDLVDWPEWFVGRRRDKILAALYGEGRAHATYERTVGDPGGENEVVLFKSCFPNSALEGDPDDPPGSDYELSVGGAKKVYLDLLEYFATRTDKLFVAITAPPLSDPEHAANARAFNRWLVKDWLSGYHGGNVAVWDFYNVLTAPENHHRVAGGRVEHVIGRKADTLHYPSGSEDDHPSLAGNRKATAEFAPALNVFYHRWQAARPAGSPAPPRAQAPDRPEVGLPIDGFEADRAPGASGWVADPGEGASLRLARDAEGPFAGRRSLRVDVDVPANSWATCTMNWDEPTDRSRTGGVRFRIRAEAGIPYRVQVCAGDPETAGNYHVWLNTEYSEEPWVEVELWWERFERVEWEEGSGEPCPTDSVLGIGFGFASDQPIRGAVWIDEIEWIEE